MDGVKVAHRRNKIRRKFRQGGPVNCAERRETAFSARSAALGHAFAESKVFRHGWTGRQVTVAAALCAAYFLVDRVTVEFQLWNGIRAWYPPAGLSLATLFGLELRYAFFPFWTAVVCDVVNYRQPTAASFSTGSAASACARRAMAGPSVWSWLRSTIRITSTTLTPTRSSTPSFRRFPGVYLPRCVRTISSAAMAARNC